MAKLAINTSTHKKIRLFSINSDIRLSKNDQNNHITGTEKINIASKKHKRYQK